MNEAYLSLLGILFGLTFLIIAVFKGYAVLVVGPAASVIICLFSGEDVIQTLSGPFMARFSSFVANYFLIFLLSAVFGKLIGDSGAARYLAVRVATLVKRFPGKEKLLAVCALVLIQSALTYGGISAFVVVFTMVSIGKSLFEELDVPWSMYTCVSLGSSTFSMTMLPGTPSIHNLIPMQYLGTTPSAAPGIGILSSIFAAVLGFAWIWRETRRRERNGEGFLPSGAEIAKLTVADDGSPDLGLLPCLFPSILLLVVMNLLGQHPVTALVSANLATILIFRKRLPNLKAALAEGAANATNATLNTCSMAGFGGVVAAVSGYRLILGGLDKIPGPPIVQMAAAVCIAAGVTGSASAGLVIAMENLSEHFLATGLKPEIIHRIATMSSSGFDTMPHNSVVVNTLTVTRLGHKYGYRNILVTGAIIPVLCTIFGVLLVQLGVE